MCAHEHACLSICKSNSMYSYREKPKEALDAGELESQAVQLGLVKNLYWHNKHSCLKHIILNI